MRDGAYRQDDRMTKTAPKSVAVCLTAAFAGLLVPVAVSLKQRFGTKVHLYVRLPQEKLGFQHLIDSGQADSITLIPSFRSPGPCDQMDDQELFALAREYEKRLSLPLVRLTFTHRFLGRGFNIGGYYYPKSTLLNYKTSYRDQVRYYCNMLRFWENEFTEKTVDCHCSCRMKEFAQGTWQKYLIDDWIRHVMNHFGFGPTMNFTVIHVLSKATKEMTLSSPGPSEVSIKGLVVRRILVSGHS